jgi:hypothetical protein
MQDTSGRKIERSQDLADAKKPKPKAPAAETKPGASRARQDARLERRAGKWPDGALARDTGETSGSPSNHA